MHWYSRYSQFSQVTSVKIHFFWLFFTQILSIISVYWFVGLSIASYQLRKAWIWGAILGRGPFGTPAPKRKKILVFHFQQSAFKFTLFIDLKALISYLMKILDFYGPHFCLSPQKGKNFRFFVFKDSSFKFKQDVDF